MVINGKIEELIEIPKPSHHYMILEILCKDNNSNRGLQVVSFANKQNLKIGRGHDADVRITDISVSRAHADLRYINGAIYMEDHSSKFGTLV